MIALTLPWPSRDLHPNERVHWTKRASATRRARDDAYVATMAASQWRRFDLPDGRLHLWWDFYPPNRRKRDDDGLLASMKAARDGIADALGVDDSRFVSHPYLKEEVRKGGQVVVRITGGPES